VASFKQWKNSNEQHSSLDPRNHAAKRYDVTYGQNFFFVMSDAGTFIKNRRMVLKLDLQAARTTKNYIGV